MGRRIPSPGFPPISRRPNTSGGSKSRPLFRHALEIYRAGLRAARAETAIQSRLRLERTPRGERLRCGRTRLLLRPGGRVIVTGAGKASAHMARAAERVLGRRIAGGVVVTKYGHAVACRRVEILEAGHPVPDAAGVEAARRVGRWADEAGPDDLILCLISGGGSALLSAPAEGLTLEDKGAVTDSLLRAGAPIEALNCVRKHLSTLKGGQLARRALPARMLVLVVSDVIDDPLDVIASGPASGDPTTFADARRILEEFGIWKSAPPAVRRHIEKGIAGAVTETPAPGDPALSRTRHVLLANNETALRAARTKARSLGYRTRILSRRMRGEAREIGVFLAAIASEIRKDSRPIRPPACLLIGGEPTVTVRGTGLGGRCQELALSFAIHAAGAEKIALLAAGTDGTDGPTSAAGGMANGDTVKKAKKQNIDPHTSLMNNDSHHFFRCLEDIVETGPTGTNVMDLMVLLVL